jgi:hypothetical protein
MNDATIRKTIEDETDIEKLREVVISLLDGVEEKRAKFETIDPIDNRYPRDKWTRDRSQAELIPGINALRSHAKDVYAIWTRVNDLIDLCELIDKTARGVLETIEGTATWSSKEQAHYEQEIRRALEELANSGELKRWGVTSSDEIRHVHIAIGFTSSHTFVLNPEGMTRQILNP